MVICTPKAFMLLAKDILGDPPPHCAERTYRAAFGVGPEVSSHVWEYISIYKKKPTKGLPKHLLWTLMYMKCYDAESLLAAMVGTSAKNYRKWVWMFIDSVNGIYCRVVS